MKSKFDIKHTITIRQSRMPLNIKKESKDKTNVPMCIT
jgi:hypothetical protein